jgi:hypothetical protein
MRECGSTNFRLMGAVLVRIVLSGCGSGNLPNKICLTQMTTMDYLKYKLYTIVKVRNSLSSNHVCAVIPPLLYRFIENIPTR